MRLSIKYLLGCLALLFLLPACKSSDDVEEATLDLSTETLTFAKDASEQTVTVSTNKDSWSAFSTQEGWLSVEQQGQTLKVKAVANEQGRDRIASVIVNAGGLQKRIAVKQSAADVILEPEETSVAFSAVGGSKKIAYTSNGVGTKVELGSAVDWLTIDKVTSHSFVLTAKENTDSHRRQVKVTLTEGTTIREIEVVQEGIIQYVLPLLKVPASLGEVIRYERARGHELVKTPDGLINATSYRFTTQSKIMTFIQYEFKTDDAPGYTSAATICEDISLVKDNADFDAYLREQSFEKSEIAKDGSYVTYRSKTIPLEIKLDIKPGGVIIRTTYVPIQPKDYPTFKTFPLTDQIPYLGDRDLKIMGRKRANVNEAKRLGVVYWIHRSSRKTTSDTRSATLNIAVTSSSSLQQRIRSPRMTPISMSAMASMVTMVRSHWGSGSMLLDVQHLPARSLSSLRTMASFSMQLCVAELRPSVIRPRNRLSCSTPRRSAGRPSSLSKCSSIAISPQVVKTP